MNFIILTYQYRSPFIKNTPLLEYAFLLLSSIYKYSKEFNVYLENLYLIVRIKDTVVSMLTK